MAGIKYKTYDIASRNWAKGSNVALELDIDASKIRSVDATLFNAQGVTYILPCVPLDNASGDYSLGYAVNVYVNAKNNLVFNFGGAWTGFGAHVTIGYVD